MKNNIGWRDYSDIPYILAATIPGKLNKPSLISSSNTQLNIAFEPSLNDGESKILDYKINYDDFSSTGNSTTNYRVVKDLPLNKNQAFNYNYNIQISDVPFTLGNYYTVNI